MKISDSFRSIQRQIIMCCLCLALSSCVGAVIGTAVDATVEVAKVPFKVAGAAVDVIVPDGDDDNDD